MFPLQVLQCNSARALWIGESLGLSSPSHVYFRLPTGRRSSRSVTVKPSFTDRRRHVTARSG